MEITSKFVIGSAQFGLDYGINNPDGQLKMSEIADILRYANKNNISRIDTAQAYGNSEKVLGKVLQDTHLKFDITTKIAPENINNIVESINASLAKTGIDKFHSVLIHDFDSYKKYQHSFEHLRTLRKNGVTDNIGFSLYYPHELEYLLDNNIDFDVVQIPYNLFDTRFEQYFNTMHELKIAIQVRSVFLQGLFFLNPSEMSNHFKSVQDKIEYLHQYASKNKIKVSDICLGVALIDNRIDEVVVGVDSIQNLKDNLTIDIDKIYRLMTNEFKSYLNESNEDILIPSRWKI